ncbi:MAG: CpsD/CapB family tyrosine-protein kinase [Phototrophicaceae bacterium]
MIQLITLTDPRSAAAEALRTLRTNLMFSGVEKPIQTLVVTSPAQADDKSTLVANLAVTFAQSGHKTILVDADLRMPQQHTIWNIPNSGGLTHMMLQDTALATPPLVAVEAVPNLWIIPAGELPPNPADLLVSQRMNEIIGVLKARADYILFDAPPVLAATDAVVLGRKTDGLLLALRAGATRRDLAARARQSLERVNVRVVGAVLTNAPRERSSGYGR